MWYCYWDPSGSLPHNGNLNFFFIQLTYLLRESGPLPTRTANGPPHPCIRDMPATNESWPLTSMLICHSSSLRVWNHIFIHDFIYYNNWALGPTGPWGLVGMSAVLVWTNPWQTSGFYSLNNECKNADLGKISWQISTMPLACLAWAWLIY